MTATTQRLARRILVLSLLGVCFLDFSANRLAHLASPDAGMDIVRGTADAPMQYRVGVVRAAYWMSQHLGLGTHYCLTLLDTASLLIAGLVLLRVLERTEVYRRAPAMMQWFGAAAFVVLVQFDLAWLLYLPRPETLPATMLVALTLWLWQLDDVGRLQQGLIAAVLLGLALLQGFVRADVACLMNLGIFVATLTPLGKRLSLPRALAAGTSLTAALAAGGVQLYLARVAYPDATYGRVKMWQLRPNLVHATRWPPFVLFMLPVVWMVEQVVRRRFAGDAAGLALLAGAIVYAALWVTIGKIDEVRIFLPFALALAPLTVEMAMLRAEKGAAVEATSG